MHFRVISSTFHVPSEGRDIGYLHVDNWNDWYKYQTLYALTYFDISGEKHDLGMVKVGEFGMAEKQARPNLPAQFDTLDDRFFSLGQDASYYSAIYQLGENISRQILAALKDVVVNDDLFRRALREDVMGVSLLRSVPVRSVEGQFKRILGGEAVLTQYSFRYDGPRPPEEIVEPVALDFEVTPESTPTNIHVLIGRNGVGKTHLLNAMTRALLNPEEDRVFDGLFTSVDFFEETHESPFANIVSVSFSAFDESIPVKEPRNVLKGIGHSIVGLRRGSKTRTMNGLR